MSKLSLPAVDPALVDSQLSWDQDYPAPFVEPCRLREWRALGDAAGLSQFGVSLTILPPAAWPAQRHWHMNEDEFIYVLEGELILIADDGEQVIKAGMVAGFPAGKQDGHHLVNRSDRIAKLLEIGTRAKADDGEYSDIDMKIEVRDAVFSVFHKNGERY